MVIPEDMNSFSLGQEISLISVGMLDFLGIFYSHGRLQRSSTRKPNHLRILAVALGHIYQVLTSVLAGFF